MEYSSCEPNSPKRYQRNSIKLPSSVFKADELFDWANEYLTTTEEFARRMDEPGKYTSDHDCWFNEPDGSDSHTALSIEPVKTKNGTIKGYKVVDQSLSKKPFASVDVVRGRIRRTRGGSHDQANQSL